MVLFGLLAVDAAVTEPIAIAIDSAGNLYIADPLGYVRKVSGGIINTIAGTGSILYYGDGGPAATAGLYLNPEGLAVDSAGTLYISDTAHYVVRAVTSDGKINTIAGNYLTGLKGDTSPTIAANTPALSVYILPQGLAIAPNGNIYVVSFGVVALARGSGSAFPAPAVATGLGGVGAFEASSFGGQFLGPVALGGWVEIYGNYLAADTRTWAASGFTGSNAPTVLDGTSVTIGGQPAYGDRAVRGPGAGDCRTLSIQRSGPKPSSGWRPIRVLHLGWSGASEPSRQSSERHGTPDLPNTVVSRTPHGGLRFCDQFS